MRIGILEDDPALSATISEMLEYASHTPTCYANGWDLLKQVVEEEHTPRHGVFDAVLIDLVLPSISGVQVITTVSTVYPELPVIVISSSPIEYLGTMKCCFPGIQILQKPFKFQDLLTSLELLAYKHRHIQLKMQDSVHSPDHQVALSQVALKGEA